MSGPRRLYLIRHGRVDFQSRDFRISPRGRQWDPPLGERGLQQAQRLAARLVHMEAPPVVYSSPFVRCRQTIEPYASRAGFTPIFEEELGEVFVGAWEGLSFEEIISEDEELARKFRDQEAMFSLAPGGETGEQLRTRVVTVVEAILERHPEGDVLMVTHGGVINAYLGHLLALDQDMFFLPENASVNSVVVEGDSRPSGASRRVRFLNDVRHLTDPQVFEPKPRKPAAESAAHGPD
ncbi:MAG: histidine phosphatase family protein [Actinomycetota bacterium]|nr:histidine phosphatase family protein [Actinomycetota bacterium]